MADSSRSRGKAPHFFKVILAATLEDKKLKIPEKFVKKFGDELSDVATLTVPNGRVWEVGVIKEGRKIWFQDGWHDFVQHHSIDVGCFLVFKLEANSSFHVHIFDASACEIDYPSYIGSEEPENAKHHDELQKDSVEILGSKSPNSPFSTLKNKVRDRFTMAGSSSKIYSPSQHNQDKPASGSVPGINRSQKYTADSLESSRYKHHYKPQSKKYKIGEMVETNESWRGKLKGNEMFNLHNAEDEQPTEVVAIKNELKRSSQQDKHELFCLLEEMGIFISESYRYFPLTMDERQRVIHAARLFKPKNPSFLIILRPNCRNYYRVILLLVQYMPAKFFKKHLSKNIKSIQIQDPAGRQWPVKLLWPKRGCSLSGEWNAFVKDKNLEKGDICVFELIGKAEFLLKVSVYKINQSY